VCLTPFEQFIAQQMIHLQDFILEHLHHHTLSNMLFYEIFETNCAWILSCFGLGVSTWFIVRPIFPMFWLSSPIFFTILCMRLRLPHPFKLQISPYVCVHIPLTLWVSTSYVVPMATSAWKPMMQFATPLLPFKKRASRKKSLWWKIQFLKYKIWKTLGG